MRSNVPTRKCFRSASYVNRQTAETNFSRGQQKPNRDFPIPHFYKMRDQFHQVIHFRSQNSRFSRKKVPKWDLFYKQSSPMPRRSSGMPLLICRNSQKLSQKSLKKILPKNHFRLLLFERISCFYCFNYFIASVNISIHIASVCFNPQYFRPIFYSPAAFWLCFSL